MIILVEIVVDVVNQVTNYAEYRRITRTVDLNNVPKNTIFPTAPVILVVKRRRVPDSFGRHRQNPGCGLHLLQQYPQRRWHVAAHC